MAQAGRGPPESVAALLEEDVLQRSANAEQAGIGEAHFPEPSAFEFSVAPSIDQPRCRSWPEAAGSSAAKWCWRWASRVVGSPMCAVPWG